MIWQEHVVSQVVMLKICLMRLIFISNNIFIVDKGLFFIYEGLEKVCFQMKNGSGKGLDFTDKGLF